MRSGFIKIFILILLLINSSHALEKISLQLNWLNQFQFAGYYMAKENGYYKEAGLDVEIREFQFGLNLTDQIIQNKADFAIGRSSLLIDKANGKDIVSILAVYQNSPLMLLVTNPEIKELKDLKNKGIMLTTDAKDTASIMAMLSSQKIFIDDIKRQEHSFNLDDLINGKTDAMGSYVSNEPIRLDKQNIPYKIFHPTDFGFEFYSDILFTSSKMINKNPNMVKAFYDATKKGWEYAFSNIGKTAEVIHQKYNTQNRKLINLVREGEELKKLAFTNDIKNFGEISETKLEKIIDIYKVLGLINKTINYDEFIYSQSNVKNTKIELTTTEAIGIFILVSGLILFIVVFTLYIMLRKKLLHTTSSLTKEIEEKTKELNKQTYVDYLTNAKNRKAYNEKVQEELERFNRYNLPFSIILFDIDDFKKINDTHGHALGDDVLIKLVKIVKKHIRKTDQLYRVGGEEFVIILPSTKLNEGKKVAEHIREIIPKEISGLLTSGEVTVSIGITEVRDGDSENRIYQRVDDLLYTSKDNGKNKVSC